MPRPQQLRSKIFLDSGDPAETQEILELFGFLDGQTTNPTLITKNPHVQAHLASGSTFTQQEAWHQYRSIVEQISSLIPSGSVSIEIYADTTTSAEQMVQQARQCNTWIPNAHIKFPANSAGIQAAQQSIAEGIRVNMTLCFSQQQAAAIYRATAGAKRGDVFVSQFVGRMFDNNLNGLDVLRNTITMLSHTDRHIEILAASFRNVYQMVKAIELGADIITMPTKLAKEWHAAGMPITTNDLTEPDMPADHVAFEVIDLHQPVDEFDVNHPLTITGLEKFVNDWSAIIKNHNH